MSRPIQKRALAEVLEITSGQVDPTLPPYAEMPHVGGDNIESGTGRIFGVRTPTELRLISGKYPFQAGEILYSKIRPALNKVTIPDFDGICSADIYPLRVRKDVAEPRYLIHVLRSRDFLLHTERHSSRTNIPKVNRHALLHYEAALPPLAEQRRIADILDKADAIRRKRHEGIQAVDQLPRAVFLQLFGDPGLNPCGYPMVRVEDVLSTDRSGTRCGPFGTALTKAEYVRSGIPVWGIDNVLPNKFRETGSLFITPGKFDELRAYAVESGDLLISRAGTVGRICVARPTVRDSIIGTNLIRVTVNPWRMLPEYLAALLTFFSDRIGDLRASSDQEAYSFMKTGVLTRLHIPLPDLARQQQFVSALTKIEVASCRHTLAADESESLFHSLVQRAFRGEL